MSAAQELLTELRARGANLYLRNSWITTKDTLMDSELVRLSKCSGEMRALLRSEAGGGAGFGNGVVIGPAFGEGCGE